MMALAGVENAQERARRIALSKKYLVVEDVVYTDSSTYGNDQLGTIEAISPKYPRSYVKKLDSGSTIRGPFYWIRLDCCGHLVGRWRNEVVLKASVKELAEATT